MIWNATPWDLFLCATSCLYPRNLFKSCSSWVGTTLPLVPLKVQELFRLSCLQDQKSTGLVRSAEWEVRGEATPCLVMPAPEAPVILGVGPSRLHRGFSQTDIGKRPGWPSQDNAGGCSPAPGEWDSHWGVLQAFGSIAVQPGTPSFHPCKWH